VDNLNREQKARARDYHNIFVANGIGKSVLTDLKDAFGGSPIDDNPFRMAFKVGAADVLRYIEERIEENVYNEDT